MSEQKGIDALQRLLETGCKIAKQDGEWWVFESDGEGVVGAKTLRQACGKLSAIDIAEHERRYAERCRRYAKNRDRYLGRN